MYSIIIKNALIYDGDLGTPFRGEIAISNDRIVAVAEKINTGAKQIIDAQGHIVCPGFIDSQNHSDSYWQLFENPNLTSTLCQGFTTIAVGNCGGSLAPLLTPEALYSIQKWHALEGANINWQTFGEYLENMNSRKFGSNVVSLVGYGTLRRGVAGDKATVMSKEELKIMARALKQSMEEGAFGLSVGLSYGHELAATMTELDQLTKIVSSYDGVLSFHLRSEGDKVVESVREAISLAQHGVRLKISHLKVKGQKYWDNFSEVITLLEDAWHQGVNLHFDIYPYTTMWQPIHSFLPHWAIEGGRNSMLERLKDLNQRNKILAYLNESVSGISDMIIASISARFPVAGKTIGQLAKNLEMSSEQTFLNLIENGGSEIMVFNKDLKKEQVEKLLLHPLALIATDGGGFLENGPQYKLVHPRCYGTAPKFLRFIIDNGHDLSDAIRKLTFSPANVIGLKNRGVIKTGYYADLVIFDPDKIADNATLSNPTKNPSGIKAVFVNGQQVVNEGKSLSINNGKFLRKQES